MIRFRALFPPAIMTGLTTALLHADREAGIEHYAVHKPLHTSTTYGYADTRDLIDVFQGKPGYTYARQGNPTTAALEAKITMMEDGLATACFATGMAAIAAVFSTLLRAGDHVVSSAFLFGNTNSVFETLRNLGVEVTFVDATSAQAVADAVQPNTRLVFVETIANPRTQVADHKGIGALCKERGLLYVIDSTMTSPWLFRGRDAQAGLVVHSLSKYIGGHGNALGGAVIDTGLFDWTAYPNIFPAYRKVKPEMQGIQQIRKKGLRDLGATLIADAAHRIAIGAETLALRVDRTCSNALALARTLAAHPKVARVYYPGLADHPQHARATELFRHYGGLLSFELVDGADYVDMLNHLRYAVRATHLGDTRTLVIPVAPTIYWEMGAERRASMGIADSLVRVSVGIEDEADLLADFTQALDATGLN
ncbi:L-methionine gamma-lyase [Ralstonia syzygii subsp. syzygii]|nr:L-methionine gamma-lyase [Ralstonia syzygii subsp. syzygii]